MITQAAMSAVEQPGAISELTTNLTLTTGRVPAPSAVCHHYHLPSTPSSLSTPHTLYYQVSNSTHLCSDLSVTVMKHAAVTVTSEALLSHRPQIVALYSLYTLPPPSPYLPLSLSCLTLGVLKKCCHIYHQRSETAETCHSSESTGTTNNNHGGSVSCPCKPRQWVRALSTRTLQLQHLNREESSSV